MQQNAALHRVQPSQQGIALRDHINRIAKRLLGFVFRRVVRYVKIGDRYERQDISVPPSWFAAPSHGAFADYRAGHSDVPVQTLQDIETWLRGCEYVATRTRNPDWTQLCRQFETERVGNCLDHALWAWRKMLELGYQAELVFGRPDPHAKVQWRHAWIVLTYNERRMWFESVTKEPAKPMLLRLSYDDDTFWPEAGVDAENKCFGYTGMLRYMQVRVETPWASS